MSFATLDAACIAIITDISGITGIKTAPTEPPKQVDAFPFAVALPGEGRAHPGPAGSFTVLTNIDVELHVALIDLPTDYDLIVPLFEPIINSMHSVMDDNETARGDVTWTPLIEMRWGNIVTIGWRFTLRDVNMQHVVT